MSWSDIKNSPEFKNLPVDGKIKARNEYFQSEGMRQIEGLSDEQKKQEAVLFFQKTGEEIRDSMTWKERVNDPYFQELPIREKRKYRDEYYNTKGIPQVKGLPENEQQKAKQDFYKQSEADIKQYEDAAKELAAKDRASMMAEPNEANNPFKKQGAYDTLKNGSLLPQNVVDGMPQYSQETLDSMGAAQDAQYLKYKSGSTARQMVTALLAGSRQGSATSRLMETFTSSKTPNDLKYQADTIPEKIFYGAGTMLDPTFFAGGAIGKLITRGGGRIAQLIPAMTSFGAQEAVGDVATKRENYGVDQFDQTGKLNPSSWEMTKAAAKGFGMGAAKGALFHTGGELTSAATGLISNPFVRNVVKHLADFPVQGVMMIAPGVLSGDVPLNLDTVAETIGIIGLLKAGHGAGFLASKIKGSLLKNNTTNLTEADAEKAVTAELENKLKPADAESSKLVENLIDSTVKKAEIGKEIFKKYNTKEEQASNFLLDNPVKKSVIYDAYNEVYGSPKSSKTVAEVLSPKEILNELRQKVGKEEFNTYMKNEKREEYKGRNAELARTVENNIIDEIMTRENVLDMKDLSDLKVDYVATGMNKLSPSQQEMVLRNVRKGFIREFDDNHITADATLKFIKDREANRDLEKETYDLQKNETANAGLLDKKPFEKRADEKIAQMDSTSREIIDTGNLKSYNSEVKFVDKTNENKEGIIDRNDLKGSITPDARRDLYKAESELVNKELLLSGQSEKLPSGLSEAEIKSILSERNALADVRLSGTIYNTRHARADLLGSTLSILKDPARMTKEAAKLPDDIKKFNKKTKLNDDTDIQSKGIIPWLGVTYQNFSRKMQRDFGQWGRDSIQMKREAGNQAHRETMDIHKDLDVFFKGYSSKDIKQLSHFMIAQQRYGAESLAEMGIKAPSSSELTPKQIEGVTKINEINHYLYEKVNAARALAGFKPLPKIENYLTFSRKFSLAEELGLDPVRQPAEFFEPKVDDYKMSKMSFASEKHRIHSTRELETDALYLVKRYSQTALQTAYTTPVISKMRKSLEANKEVIFEKSPNAYEYIDNGINYLAGLKKPSGIEPFLNGLQKMTQNLAVFQLAGNISSIIVQPLAMINTMRTIGTSYALRGMLETVSKNKRNDILDRSRHLAGRIQDVTVHEATTGAKGLLEKGIEVGTNIGLTPMKYFDYYTAIATARGAELYAREKLGLTDPKKIIEFVDDTLVSTQGSAAREDLAPAQRTVLGKAIHVFQTFGINEFNMNKGLIGIGDKSVSTMQSAKAIGKLLATYAVFDAFSAATGFDSPFPAFISKFMKIMDEVDEKNKRIAQQNLHRKAGARKEEIDASGSLLVGAIGELFTNVPLVSGGLKGGKNMFGGVAAVMMDAANLASGQKGKSIENIASRLAGIPFGNQVSKFARANEAADKEEAKKAAAQLSGRKYVPGKQKDNLESQLIRAFR